MDRRNKYQAGPLPVGGKVPYAGFMVTIFAVYGADPHHLYSMQYRSEDRGFKLFTSITHQALIDSIAAYAAFQIGDLCAVQPLGQKFRVWDRSWSFKKGTVIYLIGDVKRRIMVKPFTQEELLTARASHQRLRARDTPSGDEPLEYRDSQSDW